MASDEDDFGTVIFPKGKAPGQKPDPPTRRPDPKTIYPGAKPADPPARPPSPTLPLPASAPPPAKAALPPLPLPPPPPASAAAAPPPAEAPAPPPPCLPDPVGPSGLALVKATRVIDVCEPIPLDPAALKLLAKDQTPRQFLDALVAAEMFADAIRFLAYVLPKREAVWWAHQCVQSMDRKAPAPVLQCIERWVIDPAEDNRRSAQSAAQAAGPATPSGMAALAAFWSGGSIGPAEGAPIPPGPYQTAQGVALAVTCVALADPAQIQERYLQVLIKGVEIGNAQDRWRSK